MDLTDWLVELKKMTAEAKAKGPSSARVTAVVEQFPWDEWHQDMRDALEKPFTDVVTEQAERQAALMGNAFDAGDSRVQARAKAYVGRLIKDLDETTKDEVSTLIRSTLDTALGRDGGGLTPAQLGDLIGDAVKEKFDGYADWRADRIARTEIANAYNMGTLMAGEQAGVSRVRVLDGDQDDECREANGQVWTLDYAMSHLTAHPNCERDFEFLEGE